MIIKLSAKAALPTENPDTLPTVSGETLTYRGKSYNLSGLPDGATVEADEPFCGTISRVGGAIHLTLQYKYDMTTAEDSQSTDWADYTFTVTDGQCPDPITYKPVEVSEND